MPPISRSMAIYRRGESPACCKTCRRQLLRRISPVQLPSQSKKKEPLGAANFPLYGHIQARGVSCARKNLSPKGFSACFSGGLPTQSKIKEPLGAANFLLYGHIQARGVSCARKNLSPKGFSACFSGSTPNSIKNKRAALRATLLFLVEARGVEPLSESTSSRTSPGAVILLTFPPRHAG